MKIATYIRNQLRVPREPMYRLQVCGQFGRLFCYLSTHMPVSSTVLCILFFTCLEKNKLYAH